MKYYYQVGKRGGRGEGDRSDQEGQREGLPTLSGIWGPWGNIWQGEKIVFSPGNSAELAARLQGGGVTSAHASLHGS